mmetsp:Transcript_929/g.2028  ORF Transcript_929/g.2028 Transcript_929/m.2028 type:complete len:368 (-) Transcript_929:147-1250(-)
MAKCMGASVQCVQAKPLGRRSYRAASRPSKSVPGNVAFGCKSPSYNQQWFRSSGAAATKGEGNVLPTVSGIFNSQPSARGFTTTADDVALKPSLGGLALEAVAAAVAAVVAVMMTVTGRVASLQHPGEGQPGTGPPGGSRSSRAAHKTHIAGEMGSNTLTGMVMVTCGRTGGTSLSVRAMTPPHQMPSHLVAETMTGNGAMTAGRSVEGSAAASGSGSRSGSMLTHGTGPMSLVRQTGTGDIGNMVASGAMSGRSSGAGSMKEGSVMSGYELSMAAGKIRTASGSRAGHVMAAGPRLTPNVTGTPEVPGPQVLRLQTVGAGAEVVVIGLGLGADPCHTHQPGGVAADQQRLSHRRSYIAGMTRPEQR